jgi:dephospho-CoA kinase|tara:strand:- start:2725 stop:3315 length:591 start_codon:yes stop_codon:yes gene_type:complete
MKIIGITGGIGVGKTYITDILRRLNYPVYNSDLVSKRYINNDIQLIASIKQEFGDDMYNHDVVNSSKLSDLVFSNPSKLSKLNSLVHPLVKKDFTIWCNNQDSKIIFKEAAILFESGSNKELDAVICVCANEDVRISRIKKRDKKTEREIRLIISRQLSQDEKERLSDFKIINNGKSSLLLQINSILQTLKKVTNN